MELDAHGGLVSPPDVLVDGKETTVSGRSLRIRRHLEYFWQDKKSLETFKTKVMDIPTVMCAECAQLMYKTEVRGANDRSWIKILKEFVSPAGQAFPAF